MVWCHTLNYPAVGLGLVDYLYSSDSAEQGGDGSDRLLTADKPCHDHSARSHSKMALESNLFLQDLQGIHKLKLILIHPLRR